MRRYTKPVSVTLPSDVKARLKVIAAGRGISLSALMREITAVPHSSRQESAQ